MISLMDAIKNRKLEGSTAPQAATSRICFYCGGPLPAGRIKCCGRRECVREQDRQASRRRAELTRQARESQRRKQYAKLVAELLELTETATDEQLIDWLMARTFLQR